MAEMSGAWFRRKVRHPWLGGPLRLTMYVATVDCATLNPSLRSSPWMRGAPQSKFSILICRITVRSSKSICGRPPRERVFHRQWRRKPARCHRTSVFRLDNRHHFQDRRKPSIQPDEEPAVVICEPSPALQLTTQDDQLMSENRILRLKPAVRLEWRGQHGKNKPDQRDHRTNLSDSFVQ